MQQVVHSRFHPLSGRKSADKSVHKLSTVIEAVNEEDFNDAAERQRIEEETQHVLTLHQSILLISIACLQTETLNAQCLQLIPTSLSAIEKSTGTHTPDQTAQSVSISARENAMMESGAMITVSKPSPRVNLECMHTTLPLLLKRFGASFSQPSPGLALSLMGIFLSLAQTAAGARLLQQCSIIFYLSNHAAMNCRPSGGELPTFTAYLPSGERDGWHLLWCQSLHLVSLLIHQLSMNPSFMASAQQFFSLCQQRFWFMAERKQQRFLTMGHLEEVECSTRCITDLAAKMLRKSRAEQDAADREIIAQMRSIMLCLCEEYVKFLIG